MDLNKIIGDLIRQNGGLCALDKLHVPYAHENAGPAAKFGLGCELYLPDIDRGLLLERAIQFLKDYHQMFPQKVNEFLPTNQRRTVKFQGDPTTKIVSDASQKKPGSGYGTSLFGAVDIGLPKDDIEPYQAHVLVGRESRKKLSFVSARMPICESGENPNFDSLLNAVVRWCDICKPVHGSAGFALIFASAMGQNTEYAIHILKRFPGFDFVDGVNFSLQAGTTFNKIKGINWLTVLCDELVNELGGIQKMEAALGPNCRVHEYMGGVVIQASASPQIGDAHEGFIPEAYRTVARYTKAIRFEDYDEGLFHVPRNLDEIEETLSWIRRFD